MQQRFHLFVQHHFNNWYTARVLTHPDYVAYGASLQAIREELQRVLAQELALKRILEEESETFFEEIKQHAIHLELNAVQNERLVRVPLRVTLLEIPSKEKDRFRVWIPRLQKSFQIYDQENIVPWAEEMVRGFFHLHPVETLLRYQYERNERVMALEVTYHGAGRYKKRAEKDHEPLDDDFDFLASENPLQAVGIDLTKEAQEGRLQRAHFRDKAIQQMIRILSGTQQRSLLLVGHSGVGKTALVHELAAKIAAKQVPERLLDTPIWYVTGSRIIAGMRFLGEWQERCQKIIEEVRNQQGILYMDGILEVLMAGSKRSGLNVAQMLLPFIQKDDLVVIVEATPDALSVAEQQNMPFVQSFRRFQVPPFQASESFSILERSARRIAKEQRVIFSREAIHRALDTLARFGDADSLPGSGIRLIEQMGRLYPPSSEKRKLQARDAIKAFSQASGFPQSLIDPDQQLDIKALRSFFWERIIGQDQALELLLNLILLIKSGLNDPQKPLGSFLFMGPTGVGKTEAVLTLAEYLFGDRKRIFRFDMSEYSVPGSSLRLVGGDEGQGELTKKVREQPFAIILLDEIEKAESGVFDILLQVLGEGRLTDMTGSTVRFTHSIVIMTSNLGAQQKPPVGFGERTLHDLEEHYRDAAERFFRPEFINRIDFFVPFHPLEETSLTKIAKMMLDKALEREGFQRRKLSFSYDEGLLAQIVRRGYEPRYGARPMKRAIEQNVLIPLSRRLIRHRETTQPEHCQLYFDGEQLTILSNLGISMPLPPPLRPLHWQHDNLWERYLDDLQRRAQSWQESPILRNLRKEEDPLAARFDAILQEMEALALLSQRTPTKLPKERQQELADRALAFDLQRLALEWLLCCKAFLQKQPPSRYTMRLHTPTLHPQALRLQHHLRDAYHDLASALSIQCTLEEDAHDLVFHLEGALASLFRLESGRHLLLLDDQEAIPLIVSPLTSSSEDDAFSLLFSSPLPSQDASSLSPSHPKEAEENPAQEATTESASLQSTESASLQPTESTNPFHPPNGKRIPLLVDAPALATREMYHDVPIIREIRQDTPMIYDPQTELDFPISSADLATHLRSFLLARLALLLQPSISSR